VDLAAVDGRPPDDQADILLRELEQYRHELLERPRLVIGTKADVAESPWDGPRISSVTGEGIGELVGRLATLVTRARAEQPTPEQFVVHRPEPEGITVKRNDDGSFEVLGRDARRAVAVSDLTAPDALAYVHARLERLGVNRALERAGAKHGDTVVIGTLAFEYEDG
jgi:GTP-binding protein